MSVKTLSLIDTGVMTAANINLIEQAVRDQCFSIGMADSLATAIAADIRTRVINPTFIIGDSGRHTTEVAHNCFIDLQWTRQHIGYCGSEKLMETKMIILVSGTYFLSAQPMKLN